MDCYFDKDYRKKVFRQDMSSFYPSMSDTDYMRGYIDGLIQSGTAKLNNKFNIKEVIFNDPATIVYWEDGTKTVVKCHNETFDEEKGLAMAIAKKALGNKGNYNEIFKKYVPEKEEDFSPLADAIWTALFNNKVK